MDKSELVFDKFLFGLVRYEPYLMIKKIVQLELREAFQSKKQRNLGIWHLGGGGSSKNQKSPKFQLGIVQN